MDDKARDEITQLAGDYLAELRQPGLTYKPMQAARLLGLDKRTVLQLIHSGRLKATKVNERVYLIPRQALFDFLGIADPVSPVEVESAAR